MRACLLSIAFVWSCTAPVPSQPEPTPEPVISVSVVPPSSLDEVAPVCRLVVGGAALAPEALLLFEGELSEYHARRVRDEDLPQTLLDRRVPAVAWASPGGLVLAPSSPLALGSAHTLAALGEGPLGAIRVAAAAPPLARRLWPPPGAAGGTDHVVYCGLGAGVATVGPVLFEPGARPAELLPGADGLGAVADCRTLRPLFTAAPGEVLVPPLELSGAPLEPEPLTGAAPSPPLFAECAGSEIRFGFGCARVLDDRLVVTGPPVSSLWVFHGPLSPRARVAAAGERFVVRGLAPSATELVDFVVRDLGGHVFSEKLAVETAAPQTHLVLSEALADPLGPEPAQEWIELHNDGTAPVDLLGFRLADAGGEIELPAWGVPPGGFVVLAREDFALDGGTDVPLAESAPLVRLPVLGKNGLANGGEKLTLSRPDGSVASVLPALPKPKPGVSVARRPDAPDDLPSSFSHHGPPGASPGAPNSFAVKED